MEREGGPLRRDMRRHLRSAHPGLLLALWAGFQVAALAPYVPGAERPPLRTVTVKVVADASLRANEIWKVDIGRHLQDVNSTFRGALGVKFKIVSYEYWDAGSEGQPLAALLPGLRDLAGRSGPDRPDGEIVLGLVPEGPEGPVDPGIADYLEGIIIVKYLKKKGGICYVMLHELCHLFGAIDLRERGSVMSLERPTFRIDAFTRTIMRANRDRCFGHDKYPLSRERIAEAITLYSERQALGLGESELSICLHHLQAMLAQMGTAAQQRR